MTKSIFSLAAFLLLQILGFSQETFPVNGVHDERPIYYAFTNAHIFKSPTEYIAKGTLLIKEGRVVSCGADVKVPDGAVVKNCEGLYIYPSFIDAYSGLNVEKKPVKKEPVPFTHWNASIHPEYAYSQAYPLPKKPQDDWLASGFGVVNLHNRDGIMRGYGQLMHLGIEQPNLALINAKSAAFFSFTKGTSNVSYPTSHIGAIALIRQSLYDADWYAAEKSNTKEVTPAFAEMTLQKNAKCVFEISNPLALRNVRDIESEFGRSFLVKTSGKEYLLDKDQLQGRQLIVPIQFPKAFDVSDPYLARMVSLGEMKHWEAAPFNAYFLDQAGAVIALTRDTISSQAEFLANLKKITESGFDHNKALASLTTIPAQMLGLSESLGELRAGKLADFFISNKRFDESGFAIAQHWTRGTLAYEKQLPDLSLIGKYNLVVDGQNIELSVESVDEKNIKAKAKYASDGKELKAKIKLDNNLINIVFSTADSNSKVIYQLSGKLSLKGTVWDGNGQTNTGAWITWGGVKDRKSESDKKKAEEKKELVIPNIIHPNMAFGYESLKRENSFIITNARVWTCGPEGILENADIYVVDGKIKSVGNNQMYPTELPRINANGKHVTPGIIDEHSHIGIFGGVNEGGQASSAEVRISDAVDPWNINIYRQLAGGVTAAQLLHGSSNPIGGQSALIELKWGTNADEMLIDNAPGFIKFALGENVKRSNSRNSDGRYPETRMGVEQVYIDMFTRAQAYMGAPQNLAEDTKRKKTSTVAIQPNQRKDLELEILAEILRGERFISCHSYVQSEILMLMNVADSFNFKVNTFTHILEGYKVAEEMAEHGVTGSTFADWWAYKFEVNDAIPFNAALMLKAGVNVAINSDDAEMGRRLNQEAAKTVKYGGVSEEEAMKMVTINPAKALHLDDRMGSIEPGKQANLVVWSDHPLSIYAHPEKTLINGTVYFDASKSDEIQAAIDAERARLIALMLQDKSTDKRKPQAKDEKHYHCDTMIENYWEN